jgi:SPP1 gp7 family putative phage head morphogenesis protein
MAEIPQFHGKYIAPGRLVGSATKSAKAEVRALLARVTEELQALPQDAMRELIHVLRAAEAELERDLVHWLRGVDDGAYRFTAHQYRVALRQIRESLRVISTIEPAMYSVLEAGALRAAGLSNRWLSTEMARMAAAFGDDLPALDLPTIKHLIERNNWLLTRFAKQSKSYTEEVQRSIRRQLSIGVARNETTHQLTERIMRLVRGPKGAVGLAGNVENVAKEMARGLFSGPYAAARRIVRTELMNAYNAHHQRTIEDAAKENPGMMKRWDASADRHCELCAALDGEKVPPDSAFSSGHMYPPRHPNCRCLVTPWMAHWPEVTPLPPLDSPDARRYAHPGGAVVTRGGTAKETNRALKERTSTTSRRRRERAAQEG